MGENLNRIYSNVISQYIRYDVGTCWEKIRGIYTNYKSGTAGNIYTPEEKSKSNYGLQYGLNPNVFTEPTWLIAEKIYDENQQ